MGSCDDVMCGDDVDNVGVKWVACDKTQQKVMEVNVLTMGLIKIDASLQEQGVHCRWLDIW